MKFDICFCWPRGDDHLPFSYRFLTTYVEHPPQVEHRLVILTDPGEIDGEFDLARAIPNVHFFQSPSPGKDLSRYFAYAEQTDADLIMCLGGTTYCRRAGWGLRAVTAAQKLGEQNLYGACGHTGAGPVRPHIRTTGFWTSPKTLLRYPIRPQNHAERYMVEHGQGCLSDWYKSQGQDPWVVNFGSEYHLDRANDDPNGYARGTQANLLVGDRLTMPPYQAYA